MKGENDKGVAVTCVPKQRWLRLRGERGGATAWLVMTAFVAIAAASAGSMISGGVGTAGSDITSALNGSPTSRAASGGGQGGSNNGHTATGSGTTNSGAPTTPVASGNTSPGTPGSTGTSGTSDVFESLPGGSQQPSSGSVLTASDNAISTLLGVGGDADDGGGRGDDGDADTNDGSDELAIVQGQVDPPGDSNERNPDPTESSQDGTVTANGVDFTIGDYVPPDIFHDNGFLQNPNDNRDPVPIPLRDPTPEEIAYHAEQLSAVTTGDRVSWLPLGWFDERFTWDNAIPAYRHFLEGNGADSTFDMDEYLTDDANGRIVEQSLLADVDAAVQEATEDIKEAGELQVGQPVTFTITSDPITTKEGDPIYPYPSSVDWQRTVGGMSMWTTTEVVATLLPNGNIEVVTTTTIHGSDRYNFNRGQAAIDSGEPDSLRGVLEESGLGQQYTQTGSTVRTRTTQIYIP